MKEYSLRELKLREEIVKRIRLIDANKLNFKRLETRNYAFLFSFYFQTSLSAELIGEVVNCGNHYRGFLKVYLGKRIVLDKEDESMLVEDIYHKYCEYTERKRVELQKKKEDSEKRQRESDLSEIERILRGDI
ncbi:MAG: hypothetical protein AABX11_05950 [Nanoarchaeota archaeon]